jgi:hypothetical protein
MDYGTVKNPNFENRPLLRHLSSGDILPGMKVQDIMSNAYVIPPVLHG